MCDRQDAPGIVRTPQPTVSQPLSSGYEADTVVLGTAGLKTEVLRPWRPQFLLHFDQKKTEKLYETMFILNISDGL